MHALTKALLLTAIIPLTGCTAAVIVVAGAANDAEFSADDIAHMRMTFPVMMLLTPEDGPEKQFTGKFTGSVSGISKFNLASPDGVTCDGTIADSGKGTLTCSNGMNFTFTKAKSGIRLSGINFVEVVSKGQRINGAFGWGNHANAEALRTALAEKP
ncbi:MAG: hypothetical protein ACU0CA_10940 [Paracoccaceae bacterium]